MSSWSASAPCPNCGVDADTFGENRPVDTNSLTCLECGLLIFTTYDYETLIDLNDRRAEQDPPLPQLTELPKQEFRLYDGETENEKLRTLWQLLADIYARIWDDRPDDAMELCKQHTIAEDRDKALETLRREDPK